MNAGAYARLLAAGLLAWAGGVAAAPAVDPGEPLGSVPEVVWRDATGLHRYALQPDGSARPLAAGALPRTPLGSVWKLFVYAYLEDAAVAERPYTCTGASRDEVYCCDPGGTITRDEALVRSCGAYFEPARWAIDPAAWRRYWQAHGAPDWLGELDQLVPAREVAVEAVLEALARVPEAAQQRARADLLEVVLRTGEGSVVAALGGRLRIKTWSWQTSPDEGGRRIGGFAGWLVDGTPVWAAGPGTSTTLLVGQARALEQILPLARAPGGECVDVDLFARYPVSEVLALADGQPAPAGALHGRFEVRFDNGNRIDIDSAGDILLERAAQPRLVARLTREEYVARVLDREAAPQPVAAARALAVAIRSYLLQTASRPERCLRIADSSATQRVAPRPATAAARAVADWTADLVLAGAPVRYHSEQAGPGVLGWGDAVQRAQTGAGYAELLARAFPRADLSRWDRPLARCQPLPEAERWLRGRLPGWRPVLDREPGYIETDDFVVCRLQSGNPFVDRVTRRIHVRGWFSLQDRLDLTHEYLHLGFEAHPSGQDEQYVEALTRRLMFE